MQAEQFINDIPLTVAQSAFQGTSFSPEKRAASHRADYAATLASVYEEFKAHATKGGTLDKLEAVFARYRAGYAKTYRAWLSSSSRCISSMITGPSNFPTRRAKKWNDAAHRRLEAVVNYHEGTRRAVMRELRPDLRPIMAGDADAIQRLAVELANLERDQVKMKAANAAIRKHAKNGIEAQVRALIELGFSSDDATYVANKTHYRGPGYPSYRLTNNGANIRRVRQRLEHLEKMHAMPVSELQGDGVRIEQDPPANRIRLFFDGKPEADTRDRLKKGGFRWTPSLGAWQAYINYQTVQLAKTFVTTP
ncbi:MAG: hypothetical protein EOO81_02880 [Oxalobacteraceae bacterium]|nr:MAG: hypothetical protein EOO81_02880 [Oxalobacteraceae bacterium]